MSDPDSLDHAAIERLLRLGGNKFAIEMLDLFLNYVGEKVAAACQAGTQGNLDAVAKSVHPIKSSAGNVGARRIQDLASRIEQLAQQQNAGAIQPLLIELQRAFEHLRPCLEAEKTRLAASA